MNINPNLKNLNRVLPSGGRGDYLRLDMNENPEGLPKNFVRECLGKIDGDFLSKYPEMDILRTSLSDYHKLPKECFCISDGSEMAMKYLFEVFGAKGKSLVTFAPTFAMYGVYAQMFGLKHRQIPIAKDFSLPVEELLRSIDEDTAIAALLSPNNPVGGVMEENSVRRVIEKANKYGALVVLDEAYHYFCKISYLDLVKEYENVIVLRTFSKLFSLAACRVGYAVGNSDLIESLYKVRPTFDTNAIGLFFAKELLKRKDIVKELIEKEEEGRRFLLAELKKHDYETYWGYGNYVLIRSRKAPTEVERQMKERKILIKTYENSTLLKDYIRVTTGSKQVMERFLRAFAEVDA